MKPEFDQYHAGFGAELTCPACGGNYLHHHAVEVFERGEDDQHGLHVTVEGKNASINTVLAGNPSSRRHGLTIRLSCEGCSAKPVLTISQHKGQTYLNIYDSETAAS